MISEKKMKIIRRPSCNGNTEIIAFYSEPAKMFYLAGGRYSEKLFKETKLDAHFERCLEEGTHTTMFQMCLGIPEFKKMWDQIRKLIKVQFKSGDQVIRYDNHTPEIWIAGDVIGYQKSCTVRDGDYFRVRRHFVHDKTNQSKEKYEDDFLPVDDLNKCEEARKIINKAVKELKGAGLVGGFFLHRAKAYRF